MPSEIRLPALAPDFEAGTIENWHKAVGDPIAVGDVIADVETDKAVVEIEATESGILGKILVAAGTTDVPVNSVIGVLLLEGESSEDLQKFGVVDSPSVSPIAADNVTPATVMASPSMTPVADSNPSERVFASPLARRLAIQLGVHLQTISGRGPRGRILRADVEAAAIAIKAQGTPAQSARENAATELHGGGYTTIPNSRMRKVIARRLTESKRDIPHIYLNLDCTLDTLLALRAQFNAESDVGVGAYKISVNDLIIKACALAMKDVPEVNASWTEEAILRYEDVDISVAVATSGGLITPIVRAADGKSLIEISAEIRDLASRARTGKLKPAEFQGGGFTVSNLGMHGIKQFNAIINPPQSCILAVGAGEQRPIVKNGALNIATVMSCTLSVDHRSADGAVGAGFLTAFRKYIEQPLPLFLTSPKQ